MWRGGDPAVPDATTRLSTRLHVSIARKATSIWAMRWRNWASLRRPDVCLRRTGRIHVGWFNADSGKQQVSTAPAINVSVASAPVSSSDKGPPVPPSDVAAESAMYALWRRAFLWSLGCIAVALAGLWGLRRIGPRVRAWRQAHRQAWQVSEAASFARLKRACLADDAASAYRELGTWARCAGFGTMPALCEREPALRSEVTTLERHLYAGTLSPWNGPALFRAASTARASHLTAGSRHRPGALPVLNP